MVLDVLYFRLILRLLQCCRCSKAIETKDKVEKYEEEILMPLMKCSRLITNRD